MGVPGFTAESSLRESKYNYRTLLGSNGVPSTERNSVVATLKLPLGFRGEPVSCLLGAVNCWFYGGTVYSCRRPPYRPDYWIGCNQCCEPGPH
jgi:hypothetical protein